MSSPKAPWKPFGLWALTTTNCKKAGKKLETLYKAIIFVVVDLGINVLDLRLSLSLRFRFKD